VARALNALLLLTSQRHTGPPAHCLPGLLHALCMVVELLHSDLAKAAPACEQAAPSCQDAAVQSAGNADADGIRGANCTSSLGSVASDVTQEGKAACAVIAATVLYHFAQVCNAWIMLGTVNSLYSLVQDC
jgi:hypothetical protein